MLMNKQITFITGNAAKAEQLARHLDFPVTHQKLDLLEMQSLDLREVVTNKAKEAYKHVQSSVLVDDTSVVFHALGRLPGPLIKWFVYELKNQGMCKLLDGYNDRSATATVCFGLYDGKNTHVFEGKITGKIANRPRGDNGFGWDSIFIPDGYTKTRGEMDQDEQDQTSPRRQALKKLEAYLKE